jgi:galactokinase/mevalonate kinase-like predicted kinase
MLRDECGSHTESQAAFTLLRDLIVHEMEISPIAPKRNVMEDQLVWGRSPLRLDLAGGWSDTPPYCLEHGGRVVNLAVDLNGQPPIQVFARINNRKDILLRSIDLGVSETIPSYEALLEPAALGSEFGIAKAALALSGFDPRFHTNHNYRTLQKQLDAEFGGGIELSMVCAVPKGSGLGTSSILAATVIGTLNELCGLGMDTKAISQRTLALEQLLTSGGGWQDQIGGITRGVKLLSTEPSVNQEAEISWLPGTFFEEGYANKTALLYYTGITRVAHDILGEIVRNMFLNSTSHLSIVDDISTNALFAAEACQRNNLAQLQEAVRRSWHLNQLLDSGTNPPAVQGILDSVGDCLEACKLLGAGGGGYMLMLAKDETAAQRIRDTLDASPPNSTSRFVDMTLSATGLQVTKS